MMSVVIINANRTKLKYNFVPYPHRVDMYDTSRPSGKFITTPYDDPFSHLNTIDYLAKTEGYYVINTNQQIWHIFSRYEAVECLKNRFIFVSGDSYNIQLFIGLADILIGGDYYKEFTSALSRRLHLHWVEEIFSNHKLLSGVKMVCQDVSECQGHSKDGLVHCGECLHKLQDKADAIILGTTRHLFKHKGVTAASAISDIKRVLTKVNKLIWVTGPSYNYSVVPYPYNETTRGKMADTAKVYMASKGQQGFAKQITKYNKNGVPYLDFYQLTQACRWQNCTADGGHRSRFVNRMKAQLVLNLLCKLG